MTTPTEPSTTTDNACFLTSHTIRLQMHTPGGSGRVKIENGRFSRIAEFYPFQMPACRIVKFTQTEIEIADMSHDGDGNGHLGLMIEVTTEPLSGGAIVGYTTGAATAAVIVGECRSSVTSNTPDGKTLVKWLG